MPIFAYRCDRCGFEQDVLQKRSDPLLTQCPSCGEAAFARTLTAPAFQLKGSGWYVTDFRDKGGKAGGAGDKTVTAPASNTEPTGAGAQTSDAPKADAPKADTPKADSKPTASGTSAA
jgi:putative FmdB family regulatory protein